MPSKHTPGPYLAIHFDGHDYDAPTIVESYDDIADLQETARIVTDGNWDVLGIPIALIAAAPEMYAVLKKWDRFMQDNYTPEEMSWWDETRRALAQIEGEDHAE